VFGTHHVLVAHVYYFMRRPKPLGVVAAQASLRYVGAELKAALARGRMDQIARRVVGLAPRSPQAAAAESE
jgi:hypothetical protein